MRLISLLLLLSFTCFAQTAVPIGSPILIDGHLSKGEWADAAAIPLNDFAVVHVKQSAEYVYLAVELLKNNNGTVDLYLAPADGKIYDLHASAKLGERTLHGSTWPDEWNWWNNDGWAANVSRVDSWEKRTLLKESVREYQISKARFPGSQWRLMFEIMTEAKPDWQTTKFPAQASTTDAKNWYVIRLNQ